MNILFVCTGNTCRSPMAEALMNKYSKEKDIDAYASSAGLSVVPYSKLSLFSYEAMKEYGIDISNHEPTQIDDSHIQSADLILTMTSSHAKFLKLSFPEAADKIYSLGEYTKTSDIPDPYGQDREAYQICAKKIKEAILILCESIKSK